MSVTMRTDVGVVRERNEDCAFVDRGGRFAILADGMGGHSAGEVASGMAVEIVRGALESAAAELTALASGPLARRRRKVRGIVERAIRLASDAILERGRLEPDKHGMGTTIEVVVVLAGTLFIAHVGDSRTYLLRDGEITQLTEDHTVAENMRRAGTWTAAEAAVSPMRSALSSAVGVMNGFLIDHVDIALRGGDRVLVCSDGLHDYFADSEIADALPDLDALVDAAKARGGHDNITGIVLELPAGAPGEVPDHVEDAPTNRVAVPLALGVR